MVAYAVAQISDLHVVPAGRWLNGDIDTAAFARAAVDHLNHFTPQPDAVLATGDLVDGGQTVDYENLRDLMAPLRAPLWLLPGNHDDRRVLRSVFPGRPELGGDGPVQFVIDGPLRVVALDSSRAGEAGGSLDAAQLAWLDATLAAAPSTPTIVALHHPPMRIGIAELDDIRVPAADAAALGAVLARSPQVRRVVCGHVHRGAVGALGGLPVFACPSVFLQARLDLAGGEIDLIPGAPAIGVHVLLDDGEVVSHVHPVG